MLQCQQPRNAALDAGKIEENVSAASQEATEPRQVHVPVWLLVSLGLSDPRASTEPLVGGVRIKGSWLWGLRGLVLVPTCWKQVSLTLLGKMEDSKTVFASTTVLVVE